MLRTGSIGTLNQIGEQLVDPDGDRLDEVVVENDVGDLVQRQHAAQSFLRVPDRFVAMTVEGVDHLAAGRDEAPVDCAQFGMTKNTQGTQF